MTRALVTEVVFHISGGDSSREIPHIRLANGFEWVALCGCHLSVSISQKQSFYGSGLLGVWLVGVNWL